MPTSKSRKKKTMPAKKKSSRSAIKVSKVDKRSSLFSNKGLVVFALLFAVVGSYFLLKSFAASPNGNGGKKTTGSTPLALTNEYVTWNPYQTNHGCMSEDDYHYREYFGSLNGSFSATEQLCDLNTDGLTSGGIGLRASASVVGTLTDMTITSPTGVAHHAVFSSSSTYKGVTTNNYQVCFVPPYYLATDTGTDPLSQSYPGNPWTYTLSGNFSKADFLVLGQMTDVTVQQTNCPASEQNLR